tara:strand:- start:545 stop:811 length:267 start_codon:yes stop_codon:yes gene_type:complete
MPTRKLTINYPDDLLVALGTTVEQFESEARLALAAKFYEMGRLSSGKAAQLAGVKRVAFLAHLHLLKISVLDLDEEEMAEEARYARGE